MGALHLEIYWTFLNMNIMNTVHGFQSSSIPCHPYLAIRLIGYQLLFKSLTLACPHYIRL